MYWKNLTDPNFNNMEKARLALHQAVQLITACGISFAEHKDDDSHTSMQYLKNKGLFCGAAFGKNKWRLAINFSTPKYVLIDRDLNAVSKNIH